LVVAAGVAIFPPAIAHAQPADPAASSGTSRTPAELARARQLYAQGLTLEAAGDWTGALASFEDVARIKVTPQVRFHLARCKEHLGRLNEALGGYRLAEYEAQQGGAKDKEIIREAQKAREALEARIPKVTIVRGKGAEAIKIELDGVALGDTQIGHEMAIDPGPHVVVGTVAPGKTFKKSFSVSETDVVRVALDVPAELADEAATSPAKSGAGAASEASSSETPPETPTEAPATPAKRSAAPWVIGGIGVASLVASAVFYKLRSDAQKKLDDGCIGHTCPDTLEDTQTQGKRYTLLSGVTLGIGIVGIGTAGIMLATGRSTPNPKAPASGAITVGPRVMSIALGGRF
jgi:hypothetical protein